MNKGPKAVARQSGGMRQAFSHGLDSELMERQAVAGATQQKAVQQQSVATGTKSSSQQSQPPSAQQAQPREVGGIVEEVAKRPASDVHKEIKNLFDPNKLLGINQEDTPEEKAKKQKLHHRYQQLTKEEQEVAKKKYQEKMQKKQAEEREKQQKEQQKQQAQAKSLPSVGKVSKRGTALMGGTKKQKAAARLAHDRQTIGKVAGAN